MTGRPPYCKGMDSDRRCIAIPELDVLRDDEVCQQCALSGGFGLVNPQPRGLGDTIRGFTKALGIDKVAGAAAKALGKEDCGCKARQEALNRLVPYADAVMVMRRKTNRKEVLDSVRCSLSSDYNAFDVEIPFTLEAIRAECKRVGNVKCIIRAEEHGKLFVNKEWARVCDWAHRVGILMLQVDFGYFDHYESRLIAEYGPDGQPIMDGWGDRPGPTPQYILDHFDRCEEAKDKAAEMGSPYQFPYVVIWTGCHAAMARRGFQHKKPEWLKVACGHVLESCLLPVIKDGGLGSLDVPDGITQIVNRDMNVNARLALHAHNNIIVNSSVSNELALWGVPVTALGTSWYDGKGVFHEPESWSDAIHPQPINYGARQDWVNWWINHQVHKDDFPNEILRRVKNGHSVLGRHG